MANVQAVPFFPSSTSQTVAALGTKFAPKDNRSIQQVSTEFESMFLSQLLKEMRGTLQPGTLFAGDKSDIQGGLFDLIMSKHLADAGGVGLATNLQQILRQVVPSGTTANHAITTQPSTGGTGGKVSGTPRS